MTGSIVYHKKKKDQVKNINPHQQLNAHSKAKTPLQY